MSVTIRVSLTSTKLATVSLRLKFYMIVQFRNKTGDVIEVYCHELQSGNWTHDYTTPITLGNTSDPEVTVCLVSFL